MRLVQKVFVFGTAMWMPMGLLIYNRRSFVASEKLIVRAQLQLLQMMTDKANVTASNGSKKASLVKLST